MNAAAVIFDLDGTLLDTLEDIAVSANAALESLGFAPHPVARYRAFIGAGVEVLFERALPAHVGGDRALIDRAVAGFKAEYADRWHVSSRPYVGVAEMLEELCRRGTPIAVLTNKPHEFAVHCVDRLLGQWEFAMVLGLCDQVAAKPDPVGALGIARGLGVAPAATMFLGDSGVDMRTAAAAGMMAVGATWGFRPRQELEESGARWLIDRPGELLELREAGGSGRV